MNVWAIADLHLSHARPDGRERFGERWRDHARTIEARWRETVRPEDLVLLPGDISMARTHRDLQPDLQWLDRLPGTKILSAGNHDAWFNAVGKVRRVLRRSILAVGGDALATHGLVVCGTLGAAPPAEDATPEQILASERQIAALDRSLAHAATLRGPETPLCVLWHYPPFDPFGKPGPCVTRIEAAGASACVYGHLHIEGQWSQAVQGVVGGIRYNCVAADAVGFRPLLIKI